MIEKTEYRRCINLNQKLSALALGYINIDIHIYTYTHTHAHTHLYHYHLGNKITSIKQFITEWTNE